MEGTIDQALFEQNPHWSGDTYSHALKRLYDKEAIQDLSLDEIQIITGIRRSGKSTLLQLLINHLMKEKSPKQILYVNFDDPNYNEVCNDVRLMYNLITSAEKLTGEKVRYLFLDEVQHVDVWEKYVKSTYDSKRFLKIFVTGSNANLLNSEYTTLLSGRYIETRIHPLSYAERLLNANITSKLDLIKNKSLALSLIDEMLVFGSFPRILQIKDDKRRKLLKTYYETILLKDCVKNNNIRDTKTLFNLAHYLISNTATTYSYNSLAKALESNENTIQSFIEIFHNAYFINELKQFSFSLKTQSRSRKKTYCIDNGLATATSFKFIDRTGKLLENLVYSELLKLNKGDIYFHNEKNECDFIWHNEKNSVAIQVAYEINPSNRDREVNGLITAMDEFLIPVGIIITYDQEEKISENIQILPFWKFFSQFEDTPILLGK